MDVPVHISNSKLQDNNYLTINREIYQYFRWMLSYIKSI
jgi:hypothetical protein